MAFYDHRIGAGHSVALASLVNIETIKPSNDRRAFYAPKVYGTHNPGVYRIHTDGTLYLAGYPSITWLFDVLTRRQYEYLKDTYCASGFSGKVTVYTTLGDLTYARYNAIMRLPKPAEIDGQFYAFKKFPVLLTRMVAL